MFAIEVFTTPASHYIRPGEEHVPVLCIKLWQSGCVLQLGVNVLLFLIRRASAMDFPAVSLLAHKSL